MKSMFDRPVTEMMKENLKSNAFCPEVSESSGLSDELSDEDIKKLLEKEE